MLRTNACFLFCYLFCCTTAALAQRASKPNVVLIMVDDMGWSDLGCYGGEIRTPHIDRLAKNGLRFTQFYNTGRCCPSRASLLTGLYPHQTGVGHMAEPPENPTAQDWGTPGYRGFLNDHCTTIAEVLKTNGYHTYMAGKWHLGLQDESKMPLQHGFEKFYGILSGASSYFKPQGNRGLSAGNASLPAPAEPNYYTTDAFTDYALRCLKQQPDTKPFFLYLAYTAPHWPLQARQAAIDRYWSQYKAGWDDIRKQRWQRQLRMGLVDKKWGISERDKRVRPWQALSQAERDTVAYRMAVYAAQVEAVDENVGKLIRHLEDQKQLDNTLILFLSDNGACAENYHELGSAPFSRINDPDFSGAVSYGIGWANASNTPFFEYKVKPYEGGISTPLIVHYPNGMNTRRGKLTAQVGHLIDVMPTLAEATGSSYPKTGKQGQAIYPLEGRSLLQVIRNGTEINRDYLFWEHQDFCAIRKGNWKAVRKIGEATWQLFDLSHDRTERVNLAKKQPALVSELDQKWNAWATSHFVFPKRVADK